ncbi:MAG: hypothetical protein B6229_00410 [Spirochaetaceae bacterium 4572_7]|nr:MAG: hypothetical protein B6229_00410 [Spirochaetaceae bacterium 4572_7]
MNYFDNSKTTLQVIEYQKLLTWDKNGNLEKLSPAAKQLSETIMIEVHKLVRAVINTHHLFKYEGYEIVESIGLDACFKSLERFNPSNMKGNKKTDLFSYLSLVTKMSIMYFNGNEYRKRLESPTVPLEVLEFHIHHDEEKTFELVESLRKRYIPILKPYLHPIFNAICDYWEVDSSHCEKRHIIRYLVQRKDEFETYFHEPVHQKLLANQYSLIMKRIRDYENGKIMPKRKR